MDKVVGVVVDVQERLQAVMPERGELERQLEVLIRGLDILSVPVALTEQLPEKLGDTVEIVRSAVGDGPCFTKSTFSCWGAPDFQKWLIATGATRVVLAGVERHICVYQTAMDLQAAGMEVLVAADATASRVVERGEWALAMLRARGVLVLPVETILLELLGDAADERFRLLLPYLKG